MSMDPNGGVPPQMPLQAEQMPQAPRKRMSTGAIVGIVVGVILAVVLVVGGGLGLLVWKAMKAAEPKPFTSAQGRFTVSMPGGEAEYKTEPAGDGDLTLHTYTKVTRVPDMGYVVTYYDLPPLEPGFERVPEQELLAAECEGIEEGVGKLQRNDPITVQGRPARDLLVPVKEITTGTRRHMRMWVVLDGERIYHVSAGPVRADGVEQDATRFLESFSINK